MIINIYTIHSSDCPERYHPGCLFLLDDLQYPNKRFFNEVNYF